MAQLASTILFSIDTALQVKGGINVETITVFNALTYRSSPVQLLTNGTGGGLEVRLPGYTSTVQVKDGVQFIIRCSGANDLVIKKEGAVTLATLTTGQVGIFMADGTTWQLVFQG